MHNNTKTICVIGLGYIGLPTAAIFAKSGWNVVGVDINPIAVHKINTGEIHIEENGLGEVVKEVVEKGRLVAQLKPLEADYYIITVPTPLGPNYYANLDYVIEATKSILPFLKKGNVVIIESTIPPRTTDDVVAPILKEAGWTPGEDIYLAHCPERVLPGRIMIELIENTRIVGGINEASAQKAADVYRSFVTGEILITSAVSAEMSKLMENTYRDVNIALANELVKISENLNIDALEVIQLANHHPRVSIHQPGPGVGGHCLAVDPYFIIEKAEKESELIRNARAINKSMPKFVINQVKKLTNRNSKIAILGLAYKGNIDDIRESPALEIIEHLKNEGFSLGIFDPHVSQEQVLYHLSTFEEAIKNAECILILTDHNEFKHLDEDLVVRLMKKPIVLDTKNCVKLDSANIEYFNFGNLGSIESKKIYST